jgi:hypothetical protein
LGERLLCKQEVIGSNPFTSTTVATAAGQCHAGRRRAAPLVRYTAGALHRRARRRVVETPPGARLMPGAGC